MRVLKSALLVGGIIAMVPLATGWVMFQTSSKDSLTHAIYPLFAIGLPGMLIESLMMSRYEPHGGGTPIEMVMIVFPLNVVFYTSATYILLKAVTTLVRCLRPRVVGNSGNAKRDS
jgi:hypothetical protein